MARSHPVHLPLHEVTRLLRLSTTSGSQASNPRVSRDLADRPQDGMDMPTKSLHQPVPPINLSLVKLEWQCLDRSSLPGGRPSLQICLVFVAPGL